MRPAILGKKIGMTRILKDAGVAVTVTVVQAGPCTVMQVKTQDSDKYDALQLGFLDVKPHRSTKPLIGHAAKAGTGPKRITREVRLDGPAELEKGAVVTVEVFSEAGVKHVDVTGITKGKGFAGPMKRWGFGGQPASHGVERKHRSPGSIGGSAPLGHGRSVKKGKKMGGQMGNRRCTTRCQELVGVDAENNLLLIAGSIPGPAGGLVFIRQCKTKP
ncbi:MAG: 50S ribosomal protein L3 [Planctomycetes bacterium]|nr:50S ribosomal protein L3 [Planctomycetota bacterium]